MKVVILCGGLGTRLREETEFKPKPMVEIGGKPILWHIMKIFSSYGFNEFVLCLGYKGSYIKNYFLSYEAMNNDFTISLGEKRKIEYHNSHSEQKFKITLADTGALTMTGGRVNRIKKYIKGDTFMVTYGDGLCDVNIQELLAFHKNHGKIATITSIRPQSRFGILNIGEGNQVNSFSEKPKSQGWINAGYFIFNKELFDLLGDDECVLEKAPLEKLANLGELMAFKHEGFFFAMDTFREFKILNDYWDSNNAPWKVW